MNPEPVTQADIDRVVDVDIDVACEDRREELPYGKSIAEIVQLEFEEE